MKTITEFAVQTLSNAAKVHGELVTAGKTPEEMPAALTEALKLEGEKLSLLLMAVEAIGNKVGDLKRVVVGSLAENEKAPSGAIEKEGKVFVCEYYRPIGGGKAGRDDRRDGRGGKGDRKGRGGKRGGRGGDRGRGGGGGTRGGPPPGRGRPAGARAGARGG